MKLFDLYGGATKGAGISAYLNELIKEGIHPDIITAVSYSSYIAVPLALAKEMPEIMEKVVEISSTVKLSDFMEKSPVNEKGGFTLSALWRATKHILTFGLLKPEISLGVQNLDSLLEQVLPEYLFEHYQDGDFAPVYISALDYKTRKTVFYNVKDKCIDYKKFKAIMNASGTMPCYTQGSYVDGRLHFDTGVIDQNAGYKFLIENIYKAQEIKEVISIFARPEGFVIPDASDPIDTFDVFNWMMECITMERSLADENDIKRYCLDHHIKWNGCYLDWIMEIFYDTDPERLEKLNESSKDRAKAFIKRYKDEVK